MLLNEYRRAYLRYMRGKWWQLRRWIPALNRRFHKREKDKMFKRAAKHDAGYFERVPHMRDR